MTKTPVLLVVCLYIVSVKGQQNQITVSPDNNTASVGGQFSIICDANDNGATPTLLINRVPAVLDNQRVTRESTVSGESTFTFVPTREDDGVNVSCTSNVNSTPSNEIVLTVLFEPMIENLSNEMIGVLEGNSAMVTFTADANPAIMEADIMVTGDTEGSAAVPTFSINDAMITLMFSNLRRDQAGTYNVTVTNSEGSNYTTFTLDVYFGPEFDAENENRMRMAAVGMRVTLDCSISGSNPMNPTVTFTTTATQNDAMLINDVITIESAVLANAGNYICTANNTQAVTTLTYVLSVGNVPMAEVTVTATANGNTLTIVFTIDTPDSSITSYRVELNGIQLGVYNDTLPTDPVDFIRELQDGTDYTVTVIAFNRYGQSMVGSGEVGFTTERPAGTAATIATTILVVMMVIISMMF